jgi:hypothetical protein
LPSSNQVEVRKEPKKDEAMRRARDTTIVFERIRKEHERCSRLFVFSCSGEKRDALLASMCVDIVGNWSLEVERGEIGEKREREREREGVLRTDFLRHTLSYTHTHTFHSFYGIQIYYRKKPVSSGLRVTK